MSLFTCENITIPIEMFLALYNEQPKTSDLKSEVLEYIRTYKQKHDPKSHRMEGFTILENGDLAFDNVLYTEAVYRGKIETYSRAAEESIEKLKSKLELLKHMGEEQINFEKQIDPLALENKVGEGEPISVEQLKMLSKLKQFMIEEET